MRESVSSVLSASLSLLLVLGGARAAPPVIGTMLANGSFRLDGATVLRTGTLFEGTVVETGTASSSIQLSSGVRLSLGTASRGKLFDDHLVLEKGETRLENATGFHFVALGLSIQPDRGSSTARIAIENPSRVRVAALTGSFHVLNARGLLIANLGPGTALMFEPQTAGGAGTRITGILQKKDGHFVVTDEVTKVTVEVTGTGLDMEVGNRVELTGSLDSAATPASGASQVVRVAQVKRLPKPASGTAAAGSGGGTVAGVSVTTIAIIGGVAAAATLGGLAAAGDLPGQGGSSSVSR